jgi:hypothetical protein
VGSYIPEKNAPLVASGAGSNCNGLEQCYILAHDGESLEAKVGQKISGETHSNYHIDNTMEVEAWRSVRE